MNIVKLNSSVTVPAGSLLSLNHEQAIAREGLIVAVDTKDVSKAVATLAAAKAVLGGLRKGNAASGKEIEAATGKVASARVALGKLRGTWRATVPVFFKGGEEIGFEGNANTREVREALGVEESSQAAATASAIEAARAEGVASGRAKMLEEVAVYNQAIDAADEAHEAVTDAEQKLAAEPDAGKKAALQKALDAARQAAAEADAHAASLKPAA